MKSVVDQIIQIEIDNLNIMVKGKPAKKKKAKKPKKKKKKKGKSMPWGKLVGHRDPRDLLSELIESGVAKKLMPAQLNDLIGDFSKLGSVQQLQKDFMPDPSMAHLRQVSPKELGWYDTVYIKIDLFIIRASLVLASKFKSI